MTIYWTAQASEHGARLIGLEQIGESSMANGVAVATFRCVASGKIYIDYRIAYLKYRSPKGERFWHLTPEDALKSWVEKADAIVATHVAGEIKRIDAAKWRTDCLRMLNTQHRAIEERKGS